MSDIYPGRVIENTVTEAWLAERVTCEGSATRVCLSHKADLAPPLVSVRYWTPRVLACKHSILKIKLCDAVHDGKVTGSRLVGSH